MRMQLLLSTELLGGGGGVIARIIWVRSFALGADVACYALLSKPKLLPFNGQLSLQAENSGTRLSLRVM